MREEIERRLKLYDAWPDWIPNRSLLMDALMELFREELKTGGGRSAPSDCSGAKASGAARETSTEKKEVPGADLATSDPAHSGPQARSGEESELLNAAWLDLVLAYTGERRAFTEMSSAFSSTDESNWQEEVKKVMGALHRYMSTVSQANRRTSDGESSEHRGPERRAQPRP